MILRSTNAVPAPPLLSLAAPAAVLALCATLGAAPPLTTRPASPAALAASMSAGQWAALPTQGYEAGSLMRGDDILAYAGKAAYDPRSRQVLFVGQVHLKGPPVFMSFAAEALRWRREATPPWAEKLKWYHAYENNAADPGRGQFYVHQSDSRLVHRLDVAKGTWATLPPLPEGASHGHGTAIEFSAERDGLLRVLNGDAWFYSVKDDAWAPLAKRLPMGPYHHFAAHSAPAGVVLFGGGNDSGAVYALGRDGPPKPCRPAPVPLGIGCSLTVVDPVSGDLLALTAGAKDKPPRFLAYTPATDAWRDLATDGLPFAKYAGHSLSAAPLPEAGAVLLFSSAPLGMKTYLYKHASPTPMVK